MIRIISGGVSTYLILVDNVVVEAPWSLLELNGADTQRYRNHGCFFSSSWNRYRTVDLIVPLSKKSRASHVPYSGQQPHAE